MTTMDEKRAALKIAFEAACPGYTLAFNEAVHKSHTGLILEHHGWTLLTDLPDRWIAEREAADLVALIKQWLAQNPPLHLP